MNNNTVIENFLLSLCPKRSRQKLLSFPIMSYHFCMTAFISIVILTLVNPSSGHRHCFFFYSIVMALGQSQPFQFLCLQITQYNSLHMHELYKFPLRTENSLNIPVIKLNYIINFHPSG